MMDEAAGSGDTLEQLRALGVRLVIDDFGTGYSSLAYLPRFSLDVLKIDQSFIAALEDDEGSEAIISAIVGMAWALGLPVIPEGIETCEQLESLRDLGCRIGQGYVFSPPVPADEIEWMLGVGEGLDDLSLPRGARSRSRAGASTPRPRSRSRS
jgi:EAL domain-containing protein (putative c-di-GMP-specific phosphodiesterase class I)